MIKRAILFFTLIFSVLFSASLTADEPKKTTEMVKLSSISDKYEPVMFDHTKHISIAENCGMCHHQHGDSSSLPCKDCHALVPATFKNSVVNNFLACSNCHGTFSPAHPSMPGLKTAYHVQCFQCHRGMDNVGLDPKSCAQMCHGKKKKN